MRHLHATCLPRTLSHTAHSPPCLDVPQVRLLLGEVPDRTEFTAPDWAQQLVPYFDITQASGVAASCAVLAVAWALVWVKPLLCACMSQVAATCPALLGLSWSHHPLHRRRCAAAT